MQLLSEYTKPSASITRLKFEKKLKRFTPKELKEEIGKVSVKQWNTCYTNALRLLRGLSGSHLEDAINLLEIESLTDAVNFVLKCRQHKKCKKDRELDDVKKLTNE